MGEMQKPDKYGVEKSAPCNSDSDCSDNEKCSSNSCVPVCSLNSCPSSEFCLNEGNHNYSCVECTSNEQCSGREICKNNACVDACVNNPCASNGQACSSQDGHSYMCYGCTTNTACNDDQICDTNAKLCKNLCPDSCPHQFCEVAASHQAKCYGCTSDEGCQKGETCDLTEGSETMNQCISQGCEAMLLAQGIPYATDVATLQAAIASGAKEIALTPSASSSSDTFYIMSPVTISGVTLYSASQTNIPQCKPMSVYLSSSLTINGATLKNIAITAYKETPNIVISGNSTLKDVSILWQNEKRNTVTFSVDGGTLNLENFSQRNGILSKGTIVRINNSNINTTGTFKDESSSLTASNSTFNLSGDSVLPKETTLTGSKLNIQKGGSLSATYLYLYSSTMIADSAVNISGGGGYSGGKLLNLGSGSKVVLNANNNKFTLSGDHAYVFNGSGELTVNGSTSISVKSNSSGDMNYVFNCPSTVNAPVTVDGLRMDKNSGDPAWYDMLINNRIVLNNTITSNSGSVRLFNSNLTSKAQIKGIKDISYNSGIVFLKGAKITVNGVCKQATSPGTYEGTNVSHSKNPPSFLTGDCQ